VTDLRVALTFDAEHPDRAPGAAVSERILDILERESARATFFLQGRWASAYPDVARRVAGAGHLVGNHSHSHAPMDHLTDAGLVEDIAEAEAAIRAAAGVDPRPWFRCPFGAGADDVRVRRALDAAGYRHIGWDVDVDDWEIGRTGQAVEADVLTGVLDRGRDTVVLLHTWPKATGDALTGIVIRLRDAGAAFVGLDELEQMPADPGAPARRTA
jgi:peptidoglycan-N-acetylglucosamine deacetylase